MMINGYIDIFSYYYMMNIWLIWYNMINNIYYNYNGYMMLYIYMLDD